MGSASIDILFDKINREAAQFIQERTLVAMRLFLKEMGRGLSVTKAAKKTGVAVFTVRRWVFRSVSGGAFPSSFRDLIRLLMACCLRRRTRPVVTKQEVGLVVARPRIMNLLCQGAGGLWTGLGWVTPDGWTSSY